MNDTLLICDQLDHCPRAKDHSCGHELPHAEEHDCQHQSCSGTFRGFCVPVDVVCVKEEKEL